MGIQGVPSIGQRVLLKVVDKLGGAEASAARLGIPPTILERFLKGMTPVPDVVLLRAVDLLDDPVRGAAPMASYAFPHTGRREN